MSQFERISVTPVAGTGVAYATGDMIGTGELTLTNAISKYAQGGCRTCVIESVTVKDLAKQSSAMDLLIFDEEPSATTFSNNDALDIDDADLPYLVGSIPVTANDYEAFNDNSMAVLFNLNKRLFCSDTESQNLYLVPVSRGTPTFVTASDLVITLGIRKKDA